MRKKKEKNLGVNIVFCLMSVIFLAPFLIIISVSLSNEADIARYGFSLIPKNLDFTAYEFIFKDFGAFGKSVVVTLVTAIIAPALACAVKGLMAYPLSRDDYRWKRVINGILIFTMLFSAGTVPTYVVLTKFYHLGNNVLIYFVTGLVDAWGVILYRTFFKGIPNDLYEASFIDGASHLQTLIHIVLPMSKAIFAIQYFLGFVNHWNSLQTSLLYMSDPDKFLIQHYMSRILESADMIKQSYAMLGLEHQIDVPVMTMRYAMCLISIIPVFVLFPKMQKHFSKGITAGSVKG